MKDLSAAVDKEQSPSSLLQPTFSGRISFACEESLPKMSQRLPSIKV
jgi:hypothetical protein